MDSMRIDKKLIESLNDIQYISNLRTCLLVRIADYAAQLCGCRSTRQVADHQSVDVDNKYYELLHRLSEREKRTVNTAVAREYVSNKKLLPCVEYLLQNGAEKGQRNNCTIALASSLFQIGHSREEVIEILDTWNQTKNEVPIPDRELYTTINSAYNNSRNGIYYGCSAFRELGVCVKNCPINK